MFRHHGLSNPRLPPNSFHDQQEVKFLFFRRLNAVKKQRHFSTSKLRSREDSIKQMRLLPALYFFQCTSDNNNCTAIAHGSIKNNSDSSHDGDILTTVDLMTFALQIAKGMVRTLLRA